jgi:hypothetical protein
MIRTISLVALLACVFAVSAEASPRYEAARRSARELAKKEREFQKKIKPLSSTEREKLVKTLRGFDDSDADGLPDAYERAVGSSDACRYDSDSDGVGDHQDDKPDGDHSYTDPTGVKVEAKGVVTSYSGGVLVVQGVSFIVDTTTVFKGSNFGATNLTAGVCIEVEGRQTGTSIAATEVKKEDSCDSGSGSDGVGEDRNKKPDGEPSNSDPKEVKVEAKGVVTSFSGGVLVVEGRSFVIDSNTVFKGRNFGTANLVAGVCVEVEGRRADTTVTAIKVKKEDSCKSGKDD